MHEHSMSKDYVKGGVRERQLVNVRGLEPDVRAAARGRQFPRLLDLFRLGVDANHLARSDDLGKPQCNGSGAAANVE